jgi:hypothetical protein
VQGAGETKSAQKRSRPGAARRAMGRRGVAAFGRSWFPERPGVPEVGAGWHWWRTPRGRPARRARGRPCPADRRRWPDGRLRPRGPPERSWCIRGTVLAASRNRSHPSGGVHHHQRALAITIAHQRSLHLSGGSPSASRPARLLRRSAQNRSKPSTAHRRWAGLPRCYPLQHQYLPTGAAPGVPPMSRPAPLLQAPSRRAKTGKSGQEWLAASEPVCPAAAALFYVLPRLPKRAHAE